MSIDEGVTARVLDAADEICIYHGSASAAEIAAIVLTDASAVDQALAVLVKRGNLVARAGGFFGRSLRRSIPRHGSTYRSEIIAGLSLQMLMGARA